MEQLSRLFRIVLVAAFILAVLEFSWQIVISVVIVGLTGYIGIELAMQYRRTEAYFNAVERYARQVGHTFSASENVQAQLNFGLIVAGLIGLFLAGVGLTIYGSTPVFACVTFLLIFGVMIALGLRQSGSSAAVRRVFAARNHWSDDGKEGMRGTVRGYPAHVEIVKTRSWSSNSAHSGMRSGSTTTFTHFTLNINNPANASFKGTGSDIKKSRPDSLRQRLLEDVDLQRRLDAIYPASFILSESELFLKRRGEAHNAVELEFVLDFLCDTAVVVEREATPI